MVRIFFLFDTGTPPEEIARVTQDVAADKIPVVSGDEVPNHSAESQNTDVQDRNRMSVALGATMSTVARDTQDPRPP